MLPITTKNSTGDNMQPCRIPLPTTKGAQRTPFCSTRHLAPLYVDLMPDSNLLDIPILLSAIIQKHAVKDHFKIYKNQMQIVTVFSTLRDYYPQRINVVNARRSRPVACLLTIYGGIKRSFIRSSMILEMI